MIRNLAFVQLTVADWPRAVAWYRDVLGLEVVLCIEAERFALLRSGGSQLALKEGQPLSGTVQFTFEAADLVVSVATLITRGVTLAAPLKVSAEGYRRVLLRDPDGYLLCLFDWLKSNRTEPIEASGEASAPR